MVQAPYEPLIKQRVCRSPSITGIIIIVIIIKFSISLRELLSGVVQLCWKKISALCVDFDLQIIV